jgi:hypothetical protein
MMETKIGLVTSNEELVTSNEGIVGSDGGPLPKDHHGFGEVVHEC